MCRDYSTNHLFDYEIISVKSRESIYKHIFLINNRVKRFPIGQNRTKKKYHEYSPHYRITYEIEVLLW